MYLLEPLPSTLRLQSYIYDKRLQMSVRDSLANSSHSFQISKSPNFTVTAN